MHRSISHHQEILAWLSEELTDAIGVSDAEALVIGAEMILQDEENPFVVVANSVAEMLQGENIPEEIVSKFSERAARLSKASPDALYRNPGPFLRDYGLIGAAMM